MFKPNVYPINQNIQFYKAFRKFSRFAPFSNLSINIKRNDAKTLKEKFSKT